MSKPAKPYATFPLFAHASGQWAKKIRGRMVYFGKWNDPDAALAKYLEQRDDLHAGRRPRADPDALTVKALANEFLNHKQERVDSGELSPRTWTDYKLACEEIVAAFGKSRAVTDLRPDDFAKLRNRLAKKCGPHRLGTTVQCIRCVFKFAYDQELINAPVRYGQTFSRPSKKTFRLHRAQRGKKLFTRDEIHKLLGAAGPQLKAMILLGINCGYGNEDCGTLPMSALDLDHEWVEFHRPKTGLERRCPLWPETVAALQTALANRPEPKNPSDEGLVFITRKRFAWAKDKAENPLTKEMVKLLRKLGINGRKGLGFYTLRHTFRTVADETKDQPAVDHIMGHESPLMSSVYRERISDERLQAVTDYVRAWLYGK
jgi:integrase